MKSHKKKLAVLFVIVFMLTALTGCGDKNSGVQSPEITAEPIKLEIGELNETQLNSMNMLNHLVVLTQEINASKNSRLYLEEAYSALINNISPDAIDSRTLIEINYLLDTLEDYRMIAVKRDRLQYIYEQNKAQSMRNAVPNPLGLMNVVQSGSLGKMIASVVFMAVDSYSSYQSASAQADLQYLQEGWGLDDKEANNLHNIRKGTFNYMVETVQDYKLPGALALTEQAVAEFVEWKNKSNNQQAIQFFENNEKVYQGYGPYWLSLAEFYYKNEDYAKCLRAISRYQEMQNNIFRRDYAYARVLPLAVVSAKEIYDKDVYIEVAKEYAADILKHTDNDNWTLRYFTAQTYIELYSLTQEIDLLQTAYDIALNNVNYLLDEQHALNVQYLAEIQEAKAPERVTKAKKKEIQQYNKLIKEERKTALPSVYEPLLLSCDLLFSLADELNISDEETKKIDAILHGDGTALFLVEPLDAMYWMEAGKQGGAYGESVSFDGSKLTILAGFVTNEADIKLTVASEGDERIFNDWAIEKVERKTEGELNTFSVSYTSESVKKYKFKAGDQIRIEVIPKVGSMEEPIVSSFEVVPKKNFLVFDGIDFQRVSE